MTDPQHAVDADADGNPDYSTEATITLSDRINLLAKIPAGVRGALYVIVGIGSVVVWYLSAKGIIGLDEVQLWLGLCAAAGITATGNLTANG